MHLSSRFSKPLFLVYVLGSLAAVLYLPYLVPMHPTASDSYLFGYNNRVGVVLLLLLAAIGSVWTRGLDLRLPSGGNARPVSRRTLAWSLLAVLFGCIVMYLLVGSWGGFGESSYGIERAWQASQGKLPYVDFEFAYGVSFLYGPVLLQHLLPIDLAQAYYLFWLLNWLLGTLLVYAVINLVDFPTTSKLSIFLLIFSAGFSSIVLMGTHYAPLRYTCPLFFILVVHRCFKSASSLSPVYAALLAIAFTIILLAISPETAIAHAFACVCLFVLLTPCWNGRWVSTFAGLLLALAVVFWVALRIDVLDTLKGFGGGAFNFPILLAPHILLFFGAVFCCACYVFQRFTQKSLHDNTLGLIAFSIPMTAAALGRCDPFHVFWNGEGLFIASMFYLSSYRVAWRWYRATFALILVIAPLRYLWPIAQKAIVLSIDSPGDHPSLASRSLIDLRRRYIATFATPAVRAKWQAGHTDTAGIVPDEIDLAVLYPPSHRIFLAPFGYQPNGIGTYLSNDIDYGHFKAFVNANTVAAVDEKLAEIQDHPDTPLLLPDDFENSCPANVVADRQLIRLLFWIPYTGKAVHPESIRQPVCTYILAHYQLATAPGPQNFQYGLWVRKLSQPPPPPLQSSPRPSKPSAEVSSLSKPQNRQNPCQHWRYILSKPGIVTPSHSLQ